MVISIHVIICASFVVYALISDISLEYDEADFYEHFREFYNDTLPEFEAAGHVVQFKVSCNYEQHLRGNVYVQYTK